MPNLDNSDINVLLSKLLLPKDNIFDNMAED